MASAGGVGVTALLALALMTPPGTAVAAGGGTGTVPVPVGVQGEELADKSIDVRAGTLAPTAAQRAAVDGRAVRWNTFGTPASIVEAGDGAQVTVARASGPAVKRSAVAPADPVAVARQYLVDNVALYGLSAAAVERLTLVTTTPIGKGTVVVLRQTLGSLPVTTDGIASIGVLDDAVLWVSSNLTRDVTPPAPPTITGDEAKAIALRESGLVEGDLTQERLLLTAVPTAHGNRAAYEITLFGPTDVAAPVGTQSWVDARTGEILVRDDLFDYASDKNNTNPDWLVFPANPPADYSSNDTRMRVCWDKETGCELNVNWGVSPLAWDVDPATGLSTFTTAGNNALDVEKWNTTNGNAFGTNYATPSPTRQYFYPWTNQWQESKCSPDVFTSPQRNDIDAAVTNLFVQHNRMHDFAYNLGFTEATWNMQRDNLGKGQLGNDPERGNAQAGGVVGGPPSFGARNNANQGTGPDGMNNITNMYLWQPNAASFYAPCVDGDYDMSIIGHEYTHAISNRMVAGPSRGLGGAAGGAMGESWSDLVAGEYLYEMGYTPAGNTPWVTGAYATGDPVTGIRNYDLSNNPLNYSDVAYDVPGAEVHSDGEIWNAIQFSVRSALVDEHGDGTPSKNEKCANGRFSYDNCPGNRMWVQLMFDSMVMTALPQPTFIDLRNAMLAADRLRFGGANQAILWEGFARAGLGQGASTTGPADPDPVASFSAPGAQNSVVTFAPAGDAAGKAVKLFIGDYEGRVTPIADTDPATPRGNTFSLVPGTYRAVAQGAGLGMQRLTITVAKGRPVTVAPDLALNVASSANGATASGDGVYTGLLIDDTEATNWASLNSPVAGKQVTVKLSGAGAQTVEKVNVSAHLHGATPANTLDPQTQNRYTALRQFAVYACNAEAGSDCSDSADFTLAYTSPADAFPGRTPRPRAPELIFRSFDIPTTTATHLQLRVVHTQCTGGPDFNGQQDNDPRANEECSTGSPQALNVRAAEFQAFTR
ncbi:M36 family metallopeptidase [Motilibacter aurantiacus]|uniref:M36 family metallopeptidase n=1 Tax=Motilibacter aurantiacus TaxID=2714955 RepID=UPI00140C2479|nr:M36 family metallopeptidase [Motilibacter aurantiacus]NHC45075.1 peptidase M36 [Motilibacter aurantiacus]